MEYLFNSLGDSIKIPLKEDSYICNRSESWIYFQSSPTEILVWTNANLTTSNRTGEINISYQDSDETHIITLTSYYSTATFEVTPTECTIPYSGDTVTFNIEAIGYKLPYLVKTDGEVSWSSDLSQCYITFPENLSGLHHVIFVAHDLNNEDTIKEVLVHQSGKTYTYYVYTGNESISDISQMTPIVNSSVSYTLNGYDKKCVAIAVPNELTLRNFSDAFNDVKEFFDDPAYTEFSKITFPTYTIYKYYSSIGNIENEFKVTFS